MSFFLRTLFGLFFIHGEAIAESSYSKTQEIIFLYSREVRVSLKMTGISGQTYLEEFLSMEEEPNYYNQRGEIATFYSGKKIFITGGIGFLGRLIVEKLLRCCPEITTIYFLIRAKKDKDTQTRFKEYFNDPVFHRLKKEQKDAEKKIVLIEGNMDEKNLGLSEIDRKRIDDTDVIFHGAASVRFQDNIRLIVNTNVRGTRDLLLLAQEMPKLKVFVYISTAYSYCIHETIDEKFYDPPLKTEEIIKLTEMLSEDQLDMITPSLIGKWPNTYAYTKAICEDTVRQYSNGIPICIVRPSIVTATAKEPVVGWINNLYGLTGFIIGGYLGIMHTVYGDEKVVCNIIPADYVVNNIIVAAWDITQKSSIAPSIVDSDEVYSSSIIDEEVPIYNIISSGSNFWSMARIISEGYRFYGEAPSTKMFWHFFVITTLNDYLFCFLQILFHWIPAYIVDSLTYCAGRKPKLLIIYRLINKFLHSMRFFTCQKWEFKNNNVLKLWNKLSAIDKRNFFFNITDFDWDSYFESYFRGSKTYVLKETMNMMEEGQKRRKKLRIAHFTLITFLFFLLLWGLYTLLHFL